MITIIALKWNDIGGIKIGQEIPDPISGQDSLCDYIRYDLIIDYIDCKLFFLLNSVASQMDIYM